MQGKSHRRDNPSACSIIKQTFNPKVLLFGWFIYKPLKKGPFHPLQPRLHEVHWDELGCSYLQLISWNDYIQPHDIKATGGNFIRAPLGVSRLAFSQSREHEKAALGSNLSMMLKRLSKLWIHIYRVPICLTTAKIIFPVVQQPNVYTHNNVGSTKSSVYRNVQCFSTRDDSRDPQEGWGEEQ